MRGSLVVAPFWSDVDLRKQGSIFYRLIEARSSLVESDIALLEFVSGFVEAKLPDKAAGFSATALLVAQWMQVSPYPNGSNANELDPTQLEFTGLVHSYMK